MKIISILVFIKQKSGAKLLAEAIDLSMVWFFQRKIAKEHLKFANRTIVEYVIFILTFFNNYIYLYIHLVKHPQIAK